MQPEEISRYLKSHGVTVHHVTALSNGAVLVYLEATLCQNGDAEEALRALPGTGQIGYPSPGSRAIMRVQVS